MPVLLYRVDERLIHGQVVLGWGNQLKPDRYVVVDAELSVSEWEQELYRLALPKQTHAEFWSPALATDHLAQWQASDERTIVLVRNLATAVELASGGALNGATLNLGGLHHSPDRRELLPYLYLDQEDVERVRWLQASGVTVVAQDLPGSPGLDGETLIARGRSVWAS